MAVCGACCAQTYAPSQFDWERMKMEHEFAERARRSREYNEMMEEQWRQIKELRLQMDRQSWDFQWERNAYAGRSQTCQHGICSPRP